MNGLIKGDLISINQVDPKTKASEKVKAKFLKYNSDKSRINCLIKGKMAWVDIETYVGKAEKLDWGNKASAKAAVQESKPNPEEKNGFDQDVTNWDTSKAEEKEKTPAPAKAVKKNQADHFKNLEKIIKKNKQISIDDLSDKSGLHNEQIESVIYAFEKDGIIKREVFDGNIVFSLIKESKIKPVKNSNKLTKSDRVLNLKKAGKSVKEIADILETSSIYVKEILTIHEGTMEVPAEGSIKREIYDLLKLGESSKDISAKIGKSNVYVNKIKRQMIAANHI